MPDASEATPIAAEISVASSTLIVRDLAAMADWYEVALGLAVIDRGPTRVLLGAGSAMLLELQGDPNAPQGAPQTPGLFHNAFLLPSRADLGHWLGHAAETGVTLSGASDHLVSDALYLDDPEGNGIEIYADRPRSDWPLGPDGTILMDTRRLDLDLLLGEAPNRPWTGMPEGTVLGHIHLKVADLDEAERFFAIGLGFARQCTYPGANFYGASGYHHHVGANVWRSRGQAPSATGTTGLAGYRLAFADAALRHAAAGRLEAAGFAITRDGGAMTTRDPSGTLVRLEA